MIQTTEHPYIITDDQILGGEPIIRICLWGRFLMP